MDAADDSSVYDLAIIGGGINGCGIARDAAGRGWRVFLCERADLASGTSSASTKLIHGGLRYLEQYEFRLVREALREREVLWRIAPHIIWPQRFVLPRNGQRRPAWLLRLGLFLYDHLGGREHLPRSRALRLAADPAGATLKPECTRGFEYADCRVDDSRLVVLNARDAAAHGATIATRTECVSARRHPGHWHVMLRDGITGQNRSIRTRALVNAAGAFVAQVGGSLSPTQAAAPPRLVKGSHIVVRRLYDHDACYTLQNADGRVVFVIPYEQDFTLIGTTDQDFTGDPAHVRISAAEIAYLCQSASTWLRAPVTPSSVVWSYAGVRALYDDGSATPQQATRDYVLQCDAPPGDPPLLSVFGGKITTYRRLAESALALLGPYLPPPRGQQEGWTGRHRLPGGDFPADEFDRQFDIASTRFPFIPPATLKRLLRAYGTEIHTMFGDATCSADLGAAFGAGLTEAELRHLIGAEWARTAEDVVWRRSKLGLRLSAAEIDAIEGAMRRLVAGASDARQQAEGLRPFEPHQRRSL